MSNRVWSVLNVLVLALIAYLLLRPTGLIGAEYVAWSQRRQARAIARELWPEIGGGGHTLSGPENIAPNIVVFSDYECPWCRQLHDTLQGFIKAHPSAAIRYRDFPLPSHPNARAGARAAVCAAEQRQFRAMHDKLFETSEWKSGEIWGRISKDIGIPDTAAFLACLRDPRTDATISRDFALGQKLLITGTPAVFGHVFRVQGAIGDSALVSLLRAE